MKLKALFFFTFILISSILHAQSDFQAGYVILNNYDTVWGEIDNKGDMKMCESCRFKAKDSETIINYSPKEIIEYRFIDGKCYVSRILESGETVFLEYLINGKLNIYFYRNEKGGDFYLVDKQGMALKVIPYKEEIRVAEDGTRVLYQSKYHVSLLQVYTNDAEGFNKESLKIVSPDHNNLIKYAQDYHNTICKDEDCIVYEKKVPFIKASVEIFYGQIFYNKKLMYLNNTSEFGSLIYFWMPRASERLYFRTGIYFRQIKEYNVVEDCFLVPTQIQYQYPHYKLKPKIFYGYNNYFYKSGATWTIATGGGLDYKISEGISLTSTFIAEFLPIAFNVVNDFIDADDKSTNFISYSIYLGFKIDF